MKKTFILLQFGKPHAWSQQFIDDVQFLTDYGWYFKIFTPNQLESKGNVEIIPMTPEEFNELTFKKTGARPQLFLTKSGVPSVHISDYLVAYGAIFEDYLKDSDFWGACGWDMVFGRLDHFVPDSVLANCDVWTDDINTINGCFVLFRNTTYINNLFKKIPDWQSKLSQVPCPKCTDGIGNHVLYGTDEYDMTEIMKHENLRYGYPKYYPYHSHDRLEGQTIPNIIRHDDNTLWELHKDIAPPNWIHARPVIGREILFYHFMKTKKWPLT